VTRTLGNTDLHAIWSTHSIEREAEHHQAAFRARWPQKELTLEEVGKKFKVTRERIRQLQNIALSKMRKAIHRNETQLTKEEIEVEERQRQRMEVIREFIEARSAKPAKSARN
jgi:RNA polymerase primary sigma factor